MSIITCLKELEERRILELEDIVEFTINKEILGYKVQTKFLMHTIDSQNDYIFNILKINKINIAEKTYRYKIDNEFSYYNDFWPYSKKDDFPALTRLVKELYRIIEEKEFKYTKFTRFEIMEI